MRLMQRSWAALLVCATVWLVSCVDDNPVVPDQTYDAAEKLKADGLTGEALRHQQRQFFLSYAVVWNLYRTDEELMDQIKTDVHSACVNRINGISRLIDDWYDLFGVKPGDKLYLAPADRVKIW